MDPGTLGSRILQHWGQGSYNIGVKDPTTLGSRILKSLNIIVHCVVTITLYCLALCCRRGERLEPAVPDASLHGRGAAEGGQQVLL